MGLTGFDPLRSVTRLRSSGAIAQCERAQDAPLRQQPDTSRDDQCQRDQSPLGPTMTASAVFMKRDRTPVNGQPAPPLAARARPLAAWGVRQGGIEPGEGTASQTGAGPAAPGRGAARPA